MYRLFLLVLLGAACAIPPPDRIGVAGQSQALGASTQAPYQPTGAGQAWTPLHEWVRLVDPLFSKTYVQSSPWPAFGERYQQITRQRVIVVPTAIGGTCLTYADPADPREPRWDPDTGDLYASFVALALEAGGVRVVTMMQGECEVSNHRDAVAYREGIERFASAILRDLGAPVVWAQIPHLSVHHETIDGAIVGAAADGVILLGPDFSDVMTEGQFYGTSNTHYHDVIEVGRRWAERLAELRVAKSW
jgi:hypothetical protein